MTIDLKSIDRSTEEGRKAWFQAFIDQNMAHNYVEAKVVKKIVKAFIKAGNPIAKIDDGEDVTDVRTLRDVQEVVFNLDECFLLPKNGGWIRIVLGNDWDCLVDYTVSLEDTLKPINDWINKHN
ncbi:hypothetical protein QEH42_gp116 [Microbacterium phage Pumpernickel]|uniref:Uncharacterized protein n=1 Tax=Microbacterium phage Pumpernickel TaxID=2885983 RepID=A0AAE8Y811_9CAUD|nr:hypothetical protein QEH42_gp051 [Microbacterium phage Pumpernickel]YP_010755342.1 hypothetical protein QEH42_gp116 [Microbacterium phage Pumpernickel]UDL15842.1 hypothetical protein SEA_PUMPERNICKEL_51 [Microbacterium phage Pumpernickel]UDL16102.1 hypothetical protein SEA_PUMPERNICKEL_352 [Microbacterium phage Pumpernickel]